jgi:hypothetical protein
MSVKEAPNVQKDKEDRKKEWLAEEVRVEFFNLEEPGVPVKFMHGTTKKPETYTLLHGGKYTLRREVTQHVESRQTPIWGYKPNGEGQMEKTLKGYKSRFQCRQLFE